MSISQTINNRIAVDLLVEIVTILKTVSGDLSTETLYNMATAEVKKYKIDLKYNNDLGICVQRMTQMSSFFKGENLSSDAVYDAIKKEDDQTSDTIFQLAYNIAGSISPILYTLRNSLIQDTEELVTQINKNIEQRQQLPALSLETFNWGNLSDPAYTHAALLAAQSMTNTFKRDTYRQTDMTYTLDKLPVQQMSNLDKGIRTILGNKLLMALSSNGTEVDEEDVNLFIKTISSSAGFGVWLSDVKLMLTGGKGHLSNGIVDTVKELARFESYNDVLQSLPSMDIGESNEMLIRNNSATFKTTALLLAASAFYHKTQLENVIVLTDKHINSDALEAFMTAGGTDDDLVNHVRYHTEISKLGIPQAGVRISKVLETVDKHRNAVADFDQKSGTRQDMINRDNIRYAVNKVLTKFHASSDGPSHITSTTADENHQLAVNKALTNATKEGASLYALVTDYLISTSENTLMQNLHHKIENILITNLSQEPDQTATMNVNQSIACAIMDMVCETIVSKYNNP